MNIFDYTTPKTSEIFTTLIKHKNIKITRIISSDSPENIEYIQDEDEWVVLLEGRAKLLIDKEEKILGKGDTLLIPANTPHKVLETAHGTLWLAVHIF
ncbi:MAG TPA: cupin domain-containing protein [Sulfurovum sp.]|nr:cupin domain-containing protein [Sulfurovum sp.]